MKDRVRKVNKEGGTWNGSHRGLREGRAAESLFCSYLYEKNGHLTRRTEQMAGREPEAHVGEREPRCFKLVHSFGPG